MWENECALVRVCARVRAGLWAQVCVHVAHVERARRGAHALTHDVK